MISNAEGWPSGHEPGSADLHCVNELTIAAPAEDVFDVIARPIGWPAIYRNALRIRHRSGPWPDLGPGSKWRWITFGVPVETEIVTFERPNRLTWVGEGLGATGAHRWILEEHSPGETHVITDETQRGVAVKVLRPLMLPAMRRLHQGWLEGIASATVAGPPSA